MESISIKLNDPEAFDRILRGPDSLPDAGEMSMVTKDNGTAAGRPCVLLSHWVKCPDGSIKLAQTTITGRLFANMAATFRGRYGPDGDRVCTADASN
jgi:hypothetical protein